MAHGARVPQADALRGGTRIDREGYERLEAVFHEAAELAGRERERYLDRACADDPDLRRHVELLLSHDLADDEETIYDRPGMGRDLLASALDAEARKPPPVPRPETIDRYTIRDRIAEGGMGVVYLAEQDHPRRQVALKVIRPGVFTEELLKRFEFEADLLGRLQHPGIARIYDAGEAETEAGRQPWYAMEYIEGVPLSQHAGARDLSLDHRLGLLARICDAVHHAHQQGIVHRDLKPANILVVEGITPDDVTPSAGTADPVGQPKVLDFGVSRLIDDQAAQITRLTQTGFVVGTVAYMSPEQARGDQSVDTRSDVYSLGVIGFELLAGRLPHECRELPFVQALRVIQEEPAPHLSSIRSEYRGDVSIIMDTALATDRERRYSSAAAMADDIRRYLTHQPIAARPPTLSYQFGRFVRRHKAFVGAASIAFFGLLIGLVFAIVAQREEARQRIVAERRTEESRQSEYAALIQLSARYAAGGDAETARRRLGSAPTERRGWEWEYLSRSLEDELAHHAMPIMPWPVPVVTRDDSHALFSVEEGTIRRFDLVRGTRADIPVGGAHPRAVFPAADGRTLLLSILGTGVARFTPGVDREPVVLFETDRNISLFLADRDEENVLFSSFGDHRGEDGIIHRFDTGNGRTTDLLTGFQAAWVMDLGPDGRTLATGSVLGRLRLFDLPSARPLLDNRERTHSARAVAISPDGRRVATANPAHGVRIFAVADGRREREFLTIAPEVSALRFHPDSDTLVVGYDDGRIRHWDVPTGECRWTTFGHASANGESRRIVRLAFPGDDGLVHAIADDGIHVRPASPPLPVVLPHAPGAWPFAYDVEFSPDGRHLLSSGWDGALRFWDVATRRPVTVLRRGEFARWARYSPDGSHLLVAWKNGFEDSIFELRDSTTLESIASFLAPCTKPCGEYVPGAGTAVLGVCTELRLVDAGSLETKASREGDSDIRAVTVSPDGSLVACGRRDGTVTIRSSRDLAELHRVRLATESCEALRFTPDGRRLFAGGLGRVLQVFDPASGREILRIDSPESREVYSFRFTSDGRRLFVGSRSAAILIRDAVTGRELLPLEGHTNYAHGLALSPDGRILASASGDNTARLWDTRPLREKIEARDRMLEAEAAAAPLVERLLKNAGGTVAALEALSTEPGLDGRQRHAARNLLLRRLGE